MQKVLFDCDNTMGLPEKDIDDALALFYLLGRNDIELLGVTTTFGNSTLEDVHPATVKLFKDLTLSDLPLIRGNFAPGGETGEAARFLAQTAARFPGEITMLGTGSLTNLADAARYDRRFFENLKQIVLMGGITKPLIIQGKSLDELNFASDPEAAFAVLQAPVPVTVLTGHVCLDGLFSVKELELIKKADAPPLFRYMRPALEAWYNTFSDWFDMQGFYMWDVVAAVYITHPELFDNNPRHVVPAIADLQKGFLAISEQQVESSRQINLPPKIKDIDRFLEIVFEAWSKVSPERLTDCI